MMEKHNDSEETESTRPLSSQAVNTAGLYHYSILPPTFFFVKK